MTKNMANTDEDTFNALKRCPYEEVSTWFKSNVSSCDIPSMNKALEWSGWTWEDIVQYDNNMKSK
jgi:hypothetical protein